MIINFDPQFVKASKILDDKIMHYEDKTSAINDSTLVREDVRGVVVRLGIVLDKSFLAQFKNLEFVATITTGVDHIDENYCNEKDIKIISLRGEVEFLEAIHATPEHTWGLLLSLIRKIPWSFDSVREGAWNRSSYFGSELNGKILGVVGFGRVGRIVANYATVFGMKVLGYDRNIIKRDGVEQVELDVLLKEADVVSIHLPLYKDIEGFFNDKCFNLMKKTAVLINTARGPIIDEEALLRALETKKIAGAALDVLTNEDKDNVISPSHPLIQFAKNHDTLLISPHTAGSTYESMSRTAQFVMKKIKGVLNEQGASQPY